MGVRRTKVSSGIMLFAGIGLGWLLAGVPAPAIRAGGGDRPDAALVTTAAIATETNQARKIQITNDAIYYLNYSRGFLYAAVPMPMQSVTSARLLSDFAERDLLKDFQLAPGTTPHFAITTGTMGGLSEGWAALYIFETTTGQYAAYRADPQLRPGSNVPVLQLIEKRKDDRLGLARTPATVSSK